MKQVVQIPLQLFCAFANTGGAHDQTHSIGYCKAAHCFTKITPVLAFNTSGYPSRPWVVRHQYQVAARQRNEGGECSPLVSPLLFFNLNGYFLSLFNSVADVYPSAALKGFFGKIAAGYLLEWEKAVPVRAIVDKGRLETGLDPGYAAFIHVCFFLLPAGRLNIQVE